SQVDTKAHMVRSSTFRFVNESAAIEPLVSFTQKPIAAPFYEVPTAKDSGYDLTLGTWSGVYGPAEMPQEAVDFWATALEDVSKSDAWQETVKNNQWATELHTGDEAQAYVDDAAKTVEEDE